MTALLDANVLIALVVAEHQHHDAAHRWLSAHDDEIATCPITQGALVRFLIREGLRAEGAAAVLAGITSGPHHEFWPDDVEFDSTMLRSVIGHRQVTDAYLAALARAHGGQLVTFDRGLSGLHPGVTTLLK